MSTDFSPDILISLLSSNRYVGSGANSYRNTSRLIYRALTSPMTLEYINSLSNVLNGPILISFFVTYIVITFFDSASLKPQGQVASYFFICSSPVVNEFSTLTESGEMDFGCSAVLRESMHVSIEVLIRDLSMTSAFR